MVAPYDGLTMSSDMGERASCEPVSIASTLKFRDNHVP